MSTHFEGEGNIGSDPQVKVFPTSDNSPPRGILRLNVFFDNPVAVGEGNFEDRGGFWAPVEISRDADTCEQWSQLYQRGMRVMVAGRMIRDQWTGVNNEERSAMKVRARSVGILPYRIDEVVMAQKASVPDQTVQPSEPLEPAVPEDSFMENEGSCLTSE
ncbi:single-stranded DNA-binding protein [Halopseudomonas bauzanensis]|uniref:single-stranded DNA-binding protein n=1 Tax=Halopseudomonas bauzanensis TaxID=653930 RepID=UPI002554AA7E|nr:single-stranded DNA-binding protein [Halopseudomonas bauzanensis]